MNDAYANDMKERLMNVCNLKVPALAIKAVASKQTFDFGFRCATDCYALQVSNGRVLEKKARIEIFRNQRYFVKA